MKDYFSNRGTFTNINVAKLDGYDPNSPNKGGTIWSSDKINKLIKDHEEGLVDINGYKNSPFLSNNIEHRKPRLNYSYTKYEMDELRKCAADPIYFGEKYCKLFTEKGYVNVKLRDYQQGIIEGIKDHRNCIIMASRQIGKTTTSAIFILWYVLFNKDKNVLMLGDIADTTKEIIDKVKNICENLPFFMKPGLLINNIMSLKFDNGCRIIGRSTTKKSAIGLSINLLYMDEFAHINATFIDYFYRSVYPTISGTPNSKIIITSTPNGQNKFYEIWTNAMEGKGDFHPMRIDWWQVEGRDEEWKQLTIENLGSIEDFNQEYGLQFFKGDNLLLNSSDLKKIDSIKQNFVSRKVDALYMNKTYYADNEKKTREVDLSEYLTWNKKFLQTTFTEMHGDLRADDNFYLITIDTAKGVGKDHHVFNIWKITKLPKSFMLLNRNNINDVLDIFSVIQVGKFRCNSINIETFSDVVNNLVYNFFNTEKITVVLELNNQGVLVRDKLENHGRYWPGLLIHSKPNEAAEFYEPGIDLSSNKRKVEFCENFQHLVSIDRVVPTCKQTIQELANFGSNDTRTVYRSQTGNDDLAMTCVHSNAFFDSPQYYEICNELYDEIQDKDYLNSLEVEVIQYNERRLENQNSGTSMLDFVESSGFC